MTYIFILPGLTLTLTHLDKGPGSIHSISKDGQKKTAAQNFGQLLLVRVNNAGLDWKNSNSQTGLRPNSALGPNIKSSNIENMGR